MSGVLHQKHTPPTDEMKWGRAGLFAAKFRNARLFVFVVILPTIVVALYMFLVASDQYQSSASFVVRKAEGPASTGGFGQLLGFGIGGTTVSPSAYTVQDYLLSHETVAKLRAEDNLVSIFKRESLDIFDRLWSDNPTPESLLKYFRNQVAIEQDDITGISHLTVRTFHPEDSRKLADKLLAMGEQQINAINQRTYRDAVMQAQRSAQLASDKLNAVEAQLTQYRRNRADIDPSQTSKATIEMTSGLTSNLAVAKARLQAMQSTISTSSPQYQAMLRQVRTLEAQIAQYNAGVAGTDNSTASHLGEYEKLVIRRQEAAEMFSAANVQLEQARAEASRQQLYLIRVVQPNLPVKSEFPKRWEVILTVFASLFLAYAIGWLLWAGVKEHAM